MSYCVNCGVKLESSLKKCPLCKTLVLNPNKKTNEKVRYTYSDKLETFENRMINWKYVSKLVLTILLTLALISILCDIFITGVVSWSLYVICSVCYLGCHLMFIHFKNIYIPLIIEIIGTELFILFLAVLNNGIHWYLYLAMPFILLIGVYIIIFIRLLRRKKKNILRSLSSCFLFFAGTLILIECLIDLFRNDVISLHWSLYAVLPISIISILIFGISYNKKLLEEIKQRIFI